MLYEDITVTTADKLKLRGWFIKQKEPLKHETLVFFHANAGSKHHRCGP